MSTKEVPTVFTGQTNRRELLKKAAYVAPVILTLAAAPAFAAKGSGKNSRAGSVAGKSPQ